MSSTSWKSVQRAIIGNGAITLLKFGVFLQTGSGAMLAEAIHTLADSGNQMLLYKGLVQASKKPTRAHPFGFGRASYFWSLVSALGMFYTGACISIGHGAYLLLHPPEVIHVSKEMIGVLAASFLVDGYVFLRTLNDLRTSTPPGEPSALRYWSRHGVRDPFILAVLMEDFAACSGVMIASAGIYASHVTGDVSYDAMACVGVGALLATVAFNLIAINQRFLLGRSVDEDIVRDIRRMLDEREAIAEVFDVQSQFLGPTAFSFKAEVDFDGRVIARALEPVYAPLFRQAARQTDDEEALGRVMGLFSEDVTRAIEVEVKEVEALIRAKYPNAIFIELEPDSRKSYLKAASEFVK